MDWFILQDLLVLAIVSAGERQHLGPTLMKTCQELQVVPRCKEIGYHFIVDVCLFPDYQLKENNQIKIIVFKNQGYHRC